MKAVSDVIAPLSGEITAVNEALSDAPEKINEDPYGEGWLVKVKLTDPGEVDQLLDAAAYKELLGRRLIASRLDNGPGGEESGAVNAGGRNSSVRCSASIRRVI